MPRDSRITSLAGERKRFLVAKIRYNVLTSCGLYIVGSEYYALRVGTHGQ